MIIVGPEDDPAGIKGMRDAAGALKKIAATKAPFVIHSSLGAQEVIADIMADHDISFDPAQVTVLFDDKQRRVLKIAAEKKAYTFVGRIPFRTGKIPNDGLAVMVRGDKELMRPFVVAVANPKHVPGARVEEARKLAAYLRSPQTQEWIAQYGRGKIDDQPLFYPVEIAPVP
jgi:tungstate transport system substrate-binding protein